MKFSVVIPSRLARQNASAAADSPWFVERAIDSVRRQTLWKDGHGFECIVGVDPGFAANARARLGASARVAESAVAAQSAALNAALALADGDYIAILEDDDQWAPEFLKVALRTLSRFDFVSSTQVLVEPGGAVIRIFDFPTPSGWVMPRATYLRVGPFETAYRWHIDNEWLGRLTETGLRRAHLVEASAAVDPNAIRVSRIELRNMLTNAGPVELVRHGSPWPLIARTEHSGSGMAAIDTDDAAFTESQAEYARLTERFGHVPW